MPCTCLIAARAGTRPPLLSHSFDTSGGVDFRLVKVPPNPNPPSPRPVYKWDERAVPRFFGVGRGPVPAYEETNWRDPTTARAPEPIGHIPQTDETTGTFGYWEAASGIANDRGVMIAESSCSSIFGANVRGVDGGTALLGYMELTRIALERCATAREAVQLMGALAVEHGFAGNCKELAGSAESLSVVDGEEAWVMHVMPDDSGASAIWAAARLEEGHAAVVPNVFVIREIPLDELEQAAAPSFLLSETAREVAARLDLWRPGTPFDFAAIFSAGEPRPFYCGRRQWRALSLFAPSLGLPAEYDDLLRDAPYPFSVAADAPLARRDFFRIMRDTFQGTPFDMSAQPASGPFLMTDWFDSGLPAVEAVATSDDGEAKGEEAEAKRRILAAAAEEESAEGAAASSRDAVAFDERPIGVFRMAYSYVCEPSPSVEGGDGVLPALFHFAPHSSQTSVYLPIPCALRECPTPLSRGTVRAIDRDVAYWAFRIVKQTARGLPWDRCLSQIQERQCAWEDRADEILDEIRRGSSTLQDGEPRVHSLACEVVADWWCMLDELLLRFGDGWEHEWGEGGERRCKPIAYPDEWLRGLGFRV